MDFHLTKHVIISTRLSETGQEFQDTQIKISSDVTLSYSYRQC